MPSFLLQDDWETHGVICEPLMQQVPRLCPASRQHEVPRTDTCCLFPLLLSTPEAAMWGRQMFIAFEPYLIGDGGRAIASRSLFKKFINTTFLSGTISTTLLVPATGDCLARVCALTWQ